MISLSPEQLGKQAEENFLAGYNCAQAVVLAFADAVLIGKNELSRLACSFGGGIGRLREVCGAFSGAVLILGLLYGYDGPETGDVKLDHYARIQALAKTFEAENGQLICRDLLGLSVQHDSPVPEARTAEYYEKRPCPDIIRRCAEALARYINENPPANK